MRILLFLLACVSLLISCNDPKEMSENSTQKNSIVSTTPLEKAQDVHSYSRPNEASIEHIAMDLNVNFEENVMEGRAVYTVDKKESDTVVLDAYMLDIKSITAITGESLSYSLSPEKKWLGSALSINLPEDVNKFEIRYSTKPGSPAIQWLNEDQTADKTNPFLFTQSQAILARTWVPCQDSPGVRFTYDAKVEVPKGMMALMSAENPVAKNDSGIYHFEMEQPIPSYLLALAVGDLEYKAISNRAGVYAEPSMLEASAAEFEDLEKMIVAAEELYGKYEWEKYDLLVLPPSFPFGGMENPRLTFATPTIIAGDKSLVSLVAHELAHSWSGNLVTNEIWNDFWLNEGFTVYFENRIMEALYGEDYAKMLAYLGYQDLKDDIAELDKKDTHLKLDLEGRNPDDGMTNVAYEKGALLLKTIEKIVGRDAFDSFLKNYFSDFAFKTMNTERFIDILQERLFADRQSSWDSLMIDKWIYGPGIPENAAIPYSDKFKKVESFIAALEDKQFQPVETKDWSTHEHLHFIRNLPEDISKESLKLIDQAFNYTSSNNSEIQAAWYELGIRKRYTAVYKPTEEFLKRVGRRKFLVPLYKALISTDEGKIMAKEIYSEARPNYHYVSVESIDEMLNWEG